MIRVKDRYTLLPELYEELTGFSHVEWWEDCDVEVCSYHDDSMERSDTLSIFIYSEPLGTNTLPDLSRARRLRPNHIILSGDMNTSSWPFHTIFYPIWLKQTLKINNHYISNSVEKPFLADVLLGGKSRTRAHIVDQIKGKGLLDSCLVSYMLRANQNPTEDVGTEYRSPALSELDDEEWLAKATVRGGLFTMVPNDNSEYGDINYLSQAVPKKIYDASYLSVVAETEQNLFCGGHFISEKISKPLISSRPFLVLSSPDYLKAMKRVGFKTFDQWWSEDYDDIEDTNDRIRAMVASLASFNSLPTATKTAYIREMRTNTEHNVTLARSDVFILPVREEIKKRVTI